MKKWLLILAFFVTFTSFDTLEAAPLVGSDSDSHGCIAGAGYAWSEALGKCTRSSEYYTLDIAPIPTTGNNTVEAMIARETNHIR